MANDPSQAHRLSQIVQGIDLTSADGRAGIKTLLSELERLSPGVIENEAARLSLVRLGCRARS